MEANMNGVFMMILENMERVNDDELVGTPLDEQLKKSKMISTLGMTAVRIADLSLKAARLEEQKVPLPTAQRKMLCLEEKHV